MAKKTARNEIEAAPEGGRSQFLAVLALLVILVALAAYLFGDHAGDPRYAVDLDAAIVQATEGHPDAESIRSSLRESLGPLLQNTSILGDELTTTVKNAIEESPWVRSVRKIRRVFPGGIELDLDLRQPYAEIEVEDGYLFADREGEVLPRALTRSRDLIARLTLHPGGDPAAPIGAWEDAWLRDAIRNGVQIWLDLDALGDGELYDYLGEVGFYAIDISNHAGRLDRAKAEMSLVSRHGRIVPGTGHEVPFLIRWGRSSRHPLAAIELSPRRKLENLRAFFKNREHGLEGLREIDLRFDDPYASER